MYQRASFQGSVHRLAQERWKLCQVVLMTILEGPTVLIEIWNHFFFKRSLAVPDFSSFNLWNSTISAGKTRQLRSFTVFKTQISILLAEGESYFPTLRLLGVSPNKIWNKTWKYLHGKSGKWRALRVQNLSVLLKWEVVVVRSFYGVVSFLVSASPWNALVFAAKTWGCLSYCHPRDPTGI